VANPIQTEKRGSQAQPPIAIGGQSPPWTPTLSEQHLPASLLAESIKPNA